MKSFYVCLLFLCAIAITGCSKEKDNALATDGATADEFAKYEAELAAVSGGESYEGDDEGGDDAAE